MIRARPNIGGILLAALLLAATVAAGCEDDRGYTEYGEGMIDGAGLTPIEWIIQDGARYQGKTVRIKGIITAVCPVTGSYLRLGKGASWIQVDLAGFTVPAGKGAGQLAFATGVVRASRKRVAIGGRGVRIMKP